MTGGDSMDQISLDDWEILPDHESPFFMEECTVGDEEAKKPSPQPLQDASVQDPVVEFKDIGDVQTESSRGEFTAKVTEVWISDPEEEEETIKSPAGFAKEAFEDEVIVEAAPDLRDEEEGGVRGDKAGLEFVGFSVGKLRVNGAGALCSFGVAAATFCIFLLGGGKHQLNQKKTQSQKIRFQMCAAGDERIHEVVEQASMLNQAMSSVMGGASTRASISFGGYYDGF
uniref:Uncharacterized protein n=1 Tax=Avena sativa TaxID=4498 RepID=A0ACD5WCJ1_AVESA